MRTSTPLFAARESADVYDCQIAPLLVSERQGLGKSTFCRMLLPKKLRAYYTDKFDLTSEAHSEKLLVEYALISMDEFDRYSERQMATLKNLMQLTEVRVKPPRSRVYRLMRRMAAFIGTSNMTEHDLCRRFRALPRCQQGGLHEPMGRRRSRRHTRTLE